MSTNVKSEFDNELLTYRTGDRPGVLTLTMVDKNNQPLNFQDKGVISFVLAKVNQDSTITEKIRATNPPLVNGYDDGRLTYTWQENDLDEAGAFKAWFEIDYFNNTFYHYPQTCCIDITVQSLE